MDKKIYPSTSSVKVDLRFVQTNDAGKEIAEVNWSSIEHPEYVVAMTHTLNGSGKANDLSLTLYHYLDPFADDKRFGKIYEKDDLGLYPDNPSYLLQLMAKGWGTIYIRYGYMQDKNINSAITKNDEASTTSWFKMYIIDASVTFDTNGIKYDITAVSTLITDTDLMGGVAYDWWTDPENRFTVKLEKIEQITKKHWYLCAYRIAAIINYIAKKSSSQFKVVFKDFLYDGDSIVFNHTLPEIFNQTADQPDLQFINDLLSYYMTVKKINKPQTYVDTSGVSHTVPSSYKWSRGWSISINDSEEDPTLLIQSTFVEYTKKDLRDLIDTNGVPVAGLEAVKETNIDKYTEMTTLVEYEPFKTETAESGTNIGSLFYNFSTFNRNLFETQTLTKSNIFYNSSNFPVSSALANTHQVYTDIISLELAYPIVGGLAGAYESKDFQTSSISTAGNEVSTNISAFTVSGVPDTTNIFKSVLTKDKDFKRVLSRLYAQGTVIIPGIGKVIAILSSVNLFIFISNQLDVTSGIYQILDQVDTITNGTYQTQLTIIKTKSFEDADVYQLADITQAPIEEE